MALCWAGAPSAAWAAGCDSSGNLRYLGVTGNGGKSVWLSATSPGQFALESASGSQTVDQWSKQRRGLRISTSGDVSNGNGGTHKLYATDAGKPCLLDTQNQKGGFVFPPALPSFPPIGALPPVTGLMPGMPGAVTPPIATLPPPSGLTPTVPGAVTPPIATLPPTSGLTPMVPGAVRPPIAPLTPPSGLTPTVPGAVAPPIATLPPTSGLTPTVPGAVTPPIATLPPPSGLTPMVPGAATPPIATLPPPTGLTPTLPSTVTPPIATLPPPSGLTPTVPGAVTPPIATLPPRGGLTPTVPGAVTPPMGTLVPPNEAARIVAGSTFPCTASVSGASASVSPDTRRVECAESQVRAPAPTGEIVPLTEGRDLVIESMWNGWVDLHRVGSADRRNGLDLDNTTGGVTLGADRRFGADFVAGLSLSLERSDSDSFGGDLTTRTKGYLLGPYVAYRVSDHWAIDAAVALGHYETDSRLAVLAGNGQASRYTLAFNANGQYEVGRALVRPRLSAYVAHMHSDSYAMQGFVAGETINLAMPQTNSNYGMVEGSSELTQSFVLSGGGVIAPYARLALRYEFARPDGGEITTGNLSTAQTGPGEERCASVRAPSPTAQRCSKPKPVTSAWASRG